MPEPKTPEVKTRDRSQNINTVRIGRGNGFAWDFYHSALATPLSHFLGWVTLAYLMINAVFATAYFWCGREAFDGVTAADGWPRWVECFFFSVQTLGTIGYGKISPVAYSSNILVTLEALIGLLSLALATGLVFSRFSRPTARVIFSNIALIAEHDGVLSLMFRVANERRNQIVDADLELYLVRNEKTAEGETYYTFNDLKLERSHTPVFAASWTVVHPIDPSSPLYGKSKQDLVDEDAQIVVSFKGTDETFAQSIRARFSYEPDEILWNRRFVDMLDWRDDTLKIYLGKINETEPLSRPNSADGI